MREASFIEAVHRLLDPAIHRQSMTGASMNTNGTPDRYYDLERDLWIEYKFTPANQVPISLVGEGRGQVTKLQERWLLRRWQAGQNAYLIFGTQRGRVISGAILPACDLPKGREALRFVPVREVAAWINTQVRKFNESTAQACRNAGEGSGGSPRHCRQSNRQRRDAE